MSDSLNARAKLAINGKGHEIVPLDDLKDRCDLKRLPYPLKMLLENLLRCEVGASVTGEHFGAGVPEPRSVPAARTGLPRT